MEAAGMAPAPADVLLSVLGAHAPVEVLAWLRGVLPQPGAAFARNAWFGAYAGAERRLRRVDLALAPDERAAFSALGIVAPEAWSAADLARAALLLTAAAALPEDEHVPLATEVFRKGDNAERVALLRSLALWPAAARFVPLAVEACRTHVVQVFAAIACENAFPARHLPDASFNQLVIKTVFLELALDRVAGWRGRVNAELVRMARDYAAERRAAGRTVSSDVESLSAAKEVPSP